MKKQEMQARYEQLRDTHESLINDFEDARDEVATLEAVCKKLDELYEGSLKRIEKLDTALAASIAANKKVANIIHEAGAKLDAIPTPFLYGKVV